jgi:uncharacterized membrane protein HdeD (DUF308 family)
MTTAVSQSRYAGIPWWLILIEGIALLILGFLLLTSPVSTAIILVQVVGIYWFVAGIFKIVSIFIDSSGWGWNLVSGILGILAGLIVIRHALLAPLVVGATLVLILGIQGLVFGVIGLVQAFRGGGWGAGIMGVVSILFGVLFLANVWGFTLSLPWALGILAIVGGILAIIAAFQAR